MAVQTPEIDVANFLAGLPGAPFGAIGTDIKWGPLQSPSDPGNETVTIWVSPQPGPPGEPLMNATVNGTHWAPRVQILVLSAPDAKEAGRAKARAVHAALHLATVPVGGSGSTSSAPYVICRSTQSDVNYDGPIRDGNGQHEFSDTFLLEWFG